MATPEASPLASVQVPTRLTNLRRVFARLETIRYLVGANLRAGNRDKVLGHLWSLLDPLLSMGVYFLIFGIGFRQAADGPLDFIVYLTIGVLVWRYHSETLAQATHCIRGNRALIHEVAFPKAILPISISLSRLYDLLWGLVALLFVLALAGAPLSVQLCWLPLLVLLQLVLTTGLAFVVAYLGTFFADTANVLAVVLRLWLYLSPIFYYVRSEVGDGGIIPSSYLHLYMLNPIAGFLEVYRAALLWNVTPDPRTLGYVAGAGLVTLVLGFALFSRGEAKFAKFI